MLHNTQKRRTAVAVAALLIAAAIGAAAAAAIVLHDQRGAQGGFISIDADEVVSVTLTNSQEGGKDVNRRSDIILVCAVLNAVQVSDFTAADRTGEVPAGGVDGYFLFEMRDGRRCFVQFSNNFISPLLEQGSADAARFQEAGSQQAFRFKAGDYGEAISDLFYRLDAESRPFIPERDDPFYEADAA